MPHPSTHSQELTMETRHVLFTGTLAGCFAYIERNLSVAPSSLLWILTEVRPGFWRVTMPEWYARFWALTPTTHTTGRYYI